MNRRDIAEMVASEQEITKTQAQIYVDSVFDAILTAIGRDEDVSIHGFGTFRVKQKTARVGTNPKTGEALHIPAHGVIVFKAASSLKAAVK